MVKKNKSIRAAQVNKKLGISENNLFYSYLATCDDLTIEKLDDLEEYLDKCEEDLWEDELTASEMEEDEENDYLEDTEQEIEEKLLEWAKELKGEMLNDGELILTTGLIHLSSPEIFILDKARESKEKKELKEKLKENPKLEEKGKDKADEEAEKEAKKEAKKDVKKEAKKWAEKEAKEKVDDTGEDLLKDPNRLATPENTFINEIKCFKEKPIYYDLSRQTTEEDRRKTRSWRKFKIKKPIRACWEFSELSK